MKRLLSIFFLLAATASMLSMSIVPHHHHGSVACLATHSCDNGKCDDLHHPQDSENTRHSGGCVFDNQFIERPERHGKGEECTLYDVYDDGQMHLFAILITPPDISVDRHTVRAGHINHNTPLRSIDLCTGGCLRAPPAILC